MTAKLHKLTPLLVTGINIGQDIPEARQASLRETLLRISGAIQVLEEKLARANGGPAEAEGLNIGRLAAADEKAAICGSRRAT
jgi:hypothetical protein